MRLRSTIRDESVGLCQKCRWSIVLRGVNTVQVHCQQLGGDVTRPKVPFAVLECNRFQEVNQPEKYDMEAIAWQIRTDRSGKVSGFTPPKQNEGS